MAIDTPPLQVLPPGLLGYFQIKSGGRNPQTLDETLVPVLDLTEWYLQATWNEAVDTSNAIPAGGGGFIPSPTLISGPNTWLYIHHFSAYVALAAAASFQMAVCYQRLAGPAFPRHFPGNGLSVPAAAINSVALASASGFWLPPSMQLGMYILSNTTAVGTVATFDLRWSSLPV